MYAGLKPRLFISPKGNIRRFACQEQYALLEIVRALVTGATGFVGHHLAALLVARGYTVRVLLRPQSEHKIAEELSVEPVFGGLADRPSLISAVAGCDLVFHCAGLVKAAHPEDFFAVNHEGTQHLLEAVLASRQKLSRFVYVSSVAAGGPSLNGQPLDETVPVAPVSPYGRSKLAGERAVLGLKEKIPVTIIRPPAVFGPRDKQMLFFFQMVKRGWIPRFSRDDRRLSLIYVGNLVQGIIQAAESPRAVGEVFFLADGRTYVTSEVVHVIAAALRVKVKQVYVPGPVLYTLAAAAELWGNITGRPPLLWRGRARDLSRYLWIVNIEKARRAFGYAPDVPLEESVRETCAWYQRAGWL